MQISTAASNESIHILQQEDGTPYLARTRQTHYLIYLWPVHSHLPAIHHSLPLCLFNVFSRYYSLLYTPQQQPKTFILPEGTEAGLKGVNSSDGVWWASVGSRVLAGDAGVCGRQKNIQTNFYVCMKKTTCT